MQGRVKWVGRFSFEMAHSPAFQFYPGDFTGDRLTIPMTTLEVGAYWLLICECWDKGNQLPNDMTELADIARMKVSDFEKVWAKRIKKCFQFDDKKNVFTQKRLGEEIKKQKAWSKKKSEAGKKGMESRWKQRGTGDNTTITVLGSDITQDNSPSLSLSSSQEEEQEVCETREPSFAESVLDGIRTELNINQLPNEPLWLIEIERAAKNNFTAEHCIETYRLMNNQDWRDGPIRPDTWANNLPNLHKLRGNKNGKTKQPSEREKSASRTINADRMANALFHGDDETLRSILGVDDENNIKGYLAS